MSALSRTLCLIYNKSLHREYRYNLRCFLGKAAFKLKPRIKVYCMLIRILTGLAFRKYAYKFVILNTIIVSIFELKPAEILRYNKMDRTLYIDFLLNLLLFFIYIYHIHIVILFKVLSI